MKFDKKLPLFRLGDIFAIFAVLVLAVYFILFSGDKNSQIKKLILIDGKSTIDLPWEIAPTEYEYPKKLILINGREKINLSWENEIIDLEKLIDRKMTIDVRDNKARVMRSDCPDKICVHSGWVSECGHIAACLPNGVALMIECR